MSLALSPSTGRGDIVLQPAYFTSSLFVLAARADVVRLASEYAQQYALSAHRPFTLFKRLWQSHGWTWIHFKVLDARSRTAFLSVVMRLFLEHIRDGPTPLDRTAALFGLYIIFHTQPSGSTPALYCAAQIQVVHDLYEEILALPDALSGEPVRPYVIYVLSVLLQTHAFQILPHAAEMHPRGLPREVVVDDVVAGGKKRGRPSKRERTTKAKETLAALDRRCSGVCDEDEWAAIRDHYLLAKSALLEGRCDALEASTRAVVERISTIGQPMSEGLSSIFNI